MSLSDYEVRASIAVRDIARATEFYEGRLGLSAEGAPSAESRIYPCGGGTALHVYESPGRAAAATGTSATWYVPHLERVVDELVAEGVEFERYDDPALRTNEKGIHDLGGGWVAWFKDPDGNTFALEQPKGE
jgi:catechol 2,3-dioxygenase-like lactoylglutathione lyase family enzyme